MGAAYGTYEVAQRGRRHGLEHATNFGILVSYNFSPVGCITAGREVLCLLLILRHRDKPASSFEK